MRIGLWEIILIIAVIIVATIIIRIFWTGRGAVEQEKESAAGIPTKASKGKKPRIFFRRTGIAFILTGIILFLAAISMFRWVLQSYVWSFIIIVIGFVMILLSKKKA